MNASYQGYPQNGNTFVPWTGHVTQPPLPPAQPPTLPVTAGTVFYPTVNTRPYSPEPDVGFLTRQMVQVCLHVFIYIWSCLSIVTKVNTLALIKFDFHKICISNILCRYSHATGAIIEGLNLTLL